MKDEEIISEFNDLRNFLASLNEEIDRIHKILGLIVKYLGIKWEDL